MCVSCECSFAFDGIANTFTMCSFCEAMFLAFYLVVDYYYVFYCLVTVFVLVVSDCLLEVHSCACKSIHFHYMHAINVSPFTLAIAADVGRKKIAR